MRSLSSRIEALEQSSALRSVQHYWDFGDHSQIFTSEKMLHYYPSKTGSTFKEECYNPANFVIGVVGPYGSGKSTMCMQFVVDHATRMPIWSHGRRKARWAFIRNTTGELYSTTLQTWLTWFGELGDISSHQKPILTYNHTFSDGKGLIELEVMFLALDRPDDVRKLKSLELTGIYLNEMCELPQNVLPHCKGRVNGRYPSKGFCSEPYWSGIIFDTNPPDEEHWIYRDFIEHPVEGYKLLRQPPGLLVDEKGKYYPNPDCDNFVNFANKDYYTKLATGQREGFVKVFCQGEFGLVEKGRRVYEEYNDDIHSVDHIEPIIELPLHLGWDFGLTPACVVYQFTNRGQLRILREYVTDRMGIRNFAKLVVLPAIKRDYPGFKIGFSDADPAGLAGDSIVEDLSCIGELNSLGLTTEAAFTNDPSIRQAAVRFFLTSMVEGQPTLLVDRQNAPIIRKGFVSGYVFRRLRVPGEERYSEEPDKNSFSHPHDALQYGALRFASLQLDQDKPKLSMDMFNPVFGGMNNSIGFRR